MVEACRYPPVGHRSVMGTGPAFGYGAIPLGEVNNRLNEATLLILMLETPKGIANADAIAAVDGVDVLLIGSNDLCTEMGIPGQLRHARLREAFETTAAACKKHGKTLGIGGVRGDLELQTELVRLGGNFIVAGSDVTYFTAAARADAKALRGAAAKGA
jgi:2-keto-3-deoxy-L-rhamnonate aldolase RhmA